MERITYRITLDGFKNGIQRQLQGFETADNMSRRIEINLVSGGDTYEIPSDHVVALMYVTTPGCEEPSVNECTIRNNTIVYDVEPIVTEGITEMQVKLIETTLDGASSVLMAPKFVVEVTDSNASDSGAEQTTTFTALENAIARAMEVYNKRLLHIEVDDDCTIRIYCADGQVYVNDSIKKAAFDTTYTLARSYVVGGTGIREGEDTDNAKYYNERSQKAVNLSEASAVSASTSAQDAKQYAYGERDSAKYYFEQARRISESFSGALRPMGTISYKNLPSLEEAVAGDMYNMAEQFTTDDSFKEGAGYEVPVGSNIYKTEDGYWDILAGSPVTGIKGSAETTFRTGNVNISPEDLGLKYDIVIDDEAGTINFIDR